MYIGVGTVLAKLGSTAKPTMLISVDDGVWKLRTETTFKTHEISFKLDQEFDETTPDGRKVRVRNYLGNGEKMGKSGVIAVTGGSLAVESRGEVLAGVSYCLPVSPNPKVRVRVRDSAKWVNLRRRSAG